MAGRKINQSRKVTANLRREQILTSANRLFSENGYENTSMNEIAQYVGLTKGALYYHFKSKEAILISLINQIEDRFRKRVNDMGHTQVTPAQYLREVLLLGAANDRFDLKLAIDIGIQAMKHPLLRRQIQKAHRRSVRQFMAAIDPSLGYSRSQLKTVGIFILCLYHGLCGLHWLDPKLVCIEEQVNLLEDLLRAKEQFRSSGHRSKHM